MFAKRVKIVLILCAIFFSPYIFVVLFCFKSALCQHASQHNGNDYIRFTTTTRLEVFSLENFYYFRFNISVCLSFLSFFLFLHYLLVFFIITANIHSCSHSFRHSFVAAFIQSAWAELCLNSRQRIALQRIAFSYIFSFSVTNKQRANKLLLLLHFLYNKILQDLPAAATKEIVEYFTWQAHPWSASVCLCSLLPSADIAAHHA